MKHTTASAMLLAAALAIPSFAAAQDVVTLHSVTIDANDQVTVVYSKNFATCAHLRSSDASCSQLGPLLHTQNHFCSQGSMVAVTRPLTAFNSGFAPGAIVKLVHGNNNSVQSACVTVECDGSYGAGCAGTGGVPVLSAIEACPPAGSSADLALTNGAPGSLAIFGFGFAPGSFPLFGCTVLLASVDATLFVLLDANGGAALSLGLPPTAGGMRFHAQAYVFDAGGPQGFAATNGYLIRVQ